MRIWNQTNKAGKKIILLLHGLSGDENSMDIFLNKIPQKYLFVSPRGLYSSNVSGYSWVEDNISTVLRIESFNPAINKLFGVIEEIALEYDCNREFHILGFSQGAALAFSMLIQKPESILSLASLAGFLPDGVCIQNNGKIYKNKKIYITHGTEDEIVPIEKAHQARNIFQTFGADVIYCEDITGHKLSIKCFNGLKYFYTSMND